MSGGALLCGLQNCFTRVRKETIIPSCPHCQKKEEVPYKEVPSARKRFWVWHDDKELFMCTVCTASCKIEERQKEQLYQAHKEKEEKRKSAEPERKMKRLMSGKKWERTASFKQKYEVPKHVTAEVEKIQNSKYLKRKGSGIVTSSSAQWAQNMKEEEVVHYPSDKANRRQSGEHLRDFEPHDIDHDVIEEGDEGAELSPSKQQRLGEPSGMKQSKSSCWDEVDELVDVSVAEERLRASLEEQRPADEGSS